MPTDNVMQPNYMLPNEQSNVVSPNFNYPASSEKKAFNQPAHNTPMSSNNLAQNQPIQQNSVINKPTTTPSASNQVVSHSIHYIFQYILNSLYDYC
jgi:hypothetical protein